MNSIPSDKFTIRALAITIQSLQGYSLHNCNALLAKFPAILDSLYQYYKQLHRAEGGGDVSHKAQQFSSHPTALKISQDITKSIIFNQLGDGPPK